MNAYVFKKNYDMTMETALMKQCEEGLEKGLEQRGGLERDN